MTGMSIWSRWDGIDGGTEDSRHEQLDAGTLFVQPKDNNMIKRYREVEGINFVVAGCSGEKKERDGWIMDGTDVFF